MTELHRDPDAAAEMAANAVLKYLEDCNINGKAAQQAWIEKVFDRIKDRIH